MDFGGSKMKTIEEVRKEFVCPSCNSRKNLAFQNDSVHCYKCNKDFDLGMKKFK